MAIWLALLAGAASLATPVLAGCIDASGVFADRFETAMSVLNGTAGDLSSDWHPDPDGDGVATGLDLCPYIYDPGQSDSDGDGIGDGCDPDFAPTVESGPVTDLALEHVTPFGVWITFTSPHTTQWGWNAVAAWSTDPTELTTLEGFGDAVDRGDSIEMGVAAPFGRRPVEPGIVISMEPGTTYHIAVTRSDWQGLHDEISNIVSFQTQPDPQLNTGSTRPAVMANAEIITQLQQRRAAGDSAWQQWENELGPAVFSAAANPDSYHPEAYCVAAGLLNLAATDGTYEDAAITLFELALQYWQDNELTGNQYRWADARLGICLDLVWNVLTPAQRTEAVEALLEEDEHPDNVASRRADTDKYASIIRTKMIDGLVACDGPGISQALSDRACDVLDIAKRRFFGVQLVKARRENGLYAKSGGYMPDGTFYGLGTTDYWLETFWAASNAGFNVGDYAPFVVHNLRSMKLHALTPRAWGFAPYGDVESILDNWDSEPHSYPVRSSQAASLGLQMGLLQAAGADTAAGWTRSLLDQHYGPDDDASFWPFLLFDHDGLAPNDYRSALPTAFADTAFGVFSDRSSWQSEASFLSFRAGWSRVDHVHADLGHFQLYRAGRWITHEAMGYDGEAARARGHNVLRLQVPSGDSDAIDQYFFGALPQADILTAGSGADHSFVVSDITAGYTSYGEGGNYYDRVERHLLWLKTDEGGRADRVFVYDFVDGGESVPDEPGVGWSLNVDQAPAINGRHATLDLPAPLGPQRVDIHVVYPQTAELAIREPVGNPDEYPGPLYTHALEMSATLGGQGGHLLTVLRAADDGTVEADNPVTVSSPSHVGALFDGHLALFAPFPEAGGLTDVVASVDSSEALNAWISGLAPEAGYDVTATQQDQTLTITVTCGGAFETDAAGLLAVRIDPDRSVESVY